MNTGCLKRHLSIRPTRMSLMAAGLAIAMPMTACIALAQEPAAVPTKMTTPEGYTARHTVDVGGRIANTAGSGAMYDTMVNLQSGPRLNGESMDLHKLATNKHALADDARITSSGFGGEPYDFAKLSASKAKLYEFNGTFRRNRQYFDYDLLGNPNLPGRFFRSDRPVGFADGLSAWPQVQHSSVMTNSVRRMTDTDLVLYPQSQIQHSSCLFAKHHAGHLAAACPFGRHSEVQRPAGAATAPLHRRIHGHGGLEAGAGHQRKLRAAHPAL